MLELLRIIFLMIHNGEVPLDTSRIRMEQRSASPILIWRIVVSVTEKTFRQVYKRDLALL